MNAIKRAELLFKEAKRLGLINPITKDGMPTIGMIADAIHDAVADAKGGSGVPDSKVIQALRAELKDAMKKWKETLDGGFKLLEDLNQCIDERNALKTRCEKQEAALKFWKYNCTYAEPSLSVAQKMTDDALVLKTPGPAIPRKPRRRK